MTVQIVETALDNGTSPATIFGDASQRAGIEAGIDTIWAQAGIDIAWVPNIIRYNSTFAYQGNAVERPTSDLNLIMSNATAAGKVNTNPSIINMFFVNLVPGRSAEETTENTASGIASIANDGIARLWGTIYSHSRTAATRSRRSLLTRSATISGSITPAVVSRT